MKQRNQFSAAAHTESYYAATAIGMRNYERLAAAERCDVCVIGGGFTGLSTALNLSEKGYDTVLPEANRVGWGASGRNGGQVGSGMTWSQKEMEEEFGNEIAGLFWELCEQAKHEVLYRIDRHRVPCDFKQGVLSAALTRDAVKDFREDARYLQEHYDHHSVRFVDRNEMQEMLGTRRYLAGILDESSGHMHPLNYAIGLAGAAAEAGTRIYESTRVSHYRRDGERYRITCEAGPEVAADYVVLAGNAYLGRVSPRLDGLIMPISSYIVATEPLDEHVVHRLNRDDVAVFDSRFCLDYYRMSADRRLLFGGAERYVPTETNNIERLVRPRILLVYPELKDIAIDYAWGGKLAVTKSRLPSVGCMDGNVYYAQGFSGHGVALTNIVGKVLAEAVSGTAEHFDAFAGIPHNAFPGGRYLRWPIYVVAMAYFAMYDRWAVWKERSKA